MKNKASIDVYICLLIEQPQIIDTMTVMSAKEKEFLGVDLLTRGHSLREISKMARISLGRLHEQE